MRRRRVYLAGPSAFISHGTVFGVKVLSERLPALSLRDQLVRHDNFSELPVLRDRERRDIANFLSYQRR